MKTKKTYGVTDRPGYFGNKTYIFSAHSTLALAIRARGNGYIDECGVRRFPWCVVHDADGWVKGEDVWGDMFPAEVVA